jgi:predicted ATPase
MLTQLRSRLPDLDPGVFALLRSLLDDEGGAATDELAWAFRKFVEAVSQEQPLVLVFDDLQWADDALLDLIEHVAFVSAGAPILLLCMARPDLLDRRPGWRGVIRLEPLTPAEAEQLIKARLAGREPGAAVSERMIAAAGGNPLFVEELAMLQESGTEQPVVPPTIQALLAARLDQLDPGERTVLEAAAVEGEVFHAGAVQALTPDEHGLTARLTALVRKEFIRPDRFVLPDEDGFRFRHLLVRDATYEAIPKAARHALHERYAAWLEGRSEKLDAFVGYHLEQAYRYRVELRDEGDEASAIARRASERLEAAATAALGRSDLAAAAALLRRAAALPPVPPERRARLLSDLGATLMEAGELEDAGGALDQARVLAETAGDECALARMRVERQALRRHRAVPGATHGVREVVEQVIPIFERAGDQRGLCRAFELQAIADWTLCRTAAAAQAWERAAEHARLAGEEHERAVIMTWLASATWFGPMPVDAAIERCNSIQAEVENHPASAAAVLRHLGALHGVAGRFELARELFATSNAAFDDLGLELDHVLSHPEAIVEMLAGDYPAAERRLRRGYEILEAMGENSIRSTTAALLARALLAEGRNPEAEFFTDVSEQLAEPDDVSTQIIWRGVRARLLAAQGVFDLAEQLVRAAVALADETDLVNYRADVLTDLASVLESAGRASEASAAFVEALRLYEEKGNVVAADAARARLDVLTAV